jgi:hypothetical protein
MKRLFTIFLILSGIILPQQPPKYAPGQAIVIFDQIAYSQIQNELLQESIQTSNPDANQLFSTLEVTRLHNILQKDTFDSVEEESGLNRSFVIYLPAYTDSEIEDAVNELKKSYLIEDAFPNTLGYELIEPNDPSFSSQSNLQRIKMPLAWDIQKGSFNIRLAIFDTGFQPTHQEINSKIYLQKDFVDINFADYPNWTFFVNEGEDYHDIDDDATGLRTHGTEVTQVGAAVTNNGYGVAGVGWNTHIVIVRCGFQAIPPGGPLSGYINTSNFINALNWIRSSNSVKVINMSLVLSTSPNSLIQNAITACINAGIVVVAAAGNTAGAPVVYPAAYPGVIAVSGVNSNDINSGWNVGPQLSVVAPANGVWINSNGNTSFGVGTSLSAPLVSGAAALILSQNPNLTPQVVKRVIEASAFKVPGMEGQIFHNYYGYGLLDVYEALRALNSIYVFKNSIMSNDNYGYLVIDNDLNHPVPSNSDLPVKYEADHVSRTDELPFLVNWNSSGTTQKFNKWYQNNSDYNLQLSFMANSQTPPIKDANFNPTVPVSIKNNFPEVGTLNPPTDDIWLKDPWFYYEVSNNWFQSNEFKSYSSPLDIQNNTVGSYGGIFLNHEYDPNGQLPFYKVRSPIQQPYDIFISQTGRNHKFYFGYWSSSGTDPLTQNNIVSGYYETPVVFRSSNAVVNANLKGTQLSNNSSAYNANGQRKAVKLSSGYNPLYNVYESLGKIWLESSTDNGQTWRIGITDSR